LQPGGLKTPGAVAAGVLQAVGGAPGGLCACDRSVLGCHAPLGICLQQPLRLVLLPAHAHVRWGCLYRLQEPRAACMMLRRPAALCLKNNERP
jgi:hypothetical protein